MILYTNEILNPIAFRTDTRYPHTFWSIEQLLSFHNEHQEGSIIHILEDIETFGNHQILVQYDV